MRYHKRLSNTMFLLVLSLSFSSCNNDFPKKDNQSTLVIGLQTWMLKNLDVDHYQNGDSIPYVQDPEVWRDLKSGAWCYYENDENESVKLYNWYAVHDPRGIAPNGWHIPSEAEYLDLINSDKFNTEEFVDDYPGFRFTNGEFYHKGSYSYFWTSSVKSGPHAAALEIGNESTNPDIDYFSLNYGFSVRCVKDNADFASVSVK